MKKLIKRRGILRAEWSQQGYSLVEVMIAATIGLIVMAVISMAIVRGTEHDMNLLTRQETRDGSMELREVVQGPACGIVQLLGDDGSAVGATSISIGNSGLDFFTPISANTSNVSQTFNEIPLNGTDGKDGLISDTMRFQTGQLYGSKLRVRDIRIMPVQIATATADGALYNYGIVGTGDQVRAQLLVTFERLGGEATSAPLQARAPVILYINQARTGIVNCASIEQLANNQQACENFGGNWIEATLTCDIESKNNAPGEALTCALDERCNVTADYVIN